MVEFVVRVPEATPPWQRVFLAGDGAALGEWSAEGVPLDRWGDGTFRTRLDVPVGFRGRFLVTPGRWRDAEADGRGHELAPRDLHVTGPTTVEANVREWGRGSVRYHPEFASQFLPTTRTLAVWVPPGYDRDPDRRFPVLYLHDGQNLFDPETAFAGNPWWANEAAERETRAGRVRPLILVGVANTPDRLREYGPRRPGGKKGDDRSREYGRFLVDEVKPFVEANYQTLPGPDHTGVGGSSMGGLISLHLAKWYPGVFGRCAAMSPSLWWDREYFLKTLTVAPRWLDWCRVWLDVGTREGASEAGMRATTRRAKWLAHLFLRRGMRAGEQFHFEVIDGGEHNEAAWGSRFDRVLRFLFPPGGPGVGRLFLDMPADQQDPRPRAAGAELRDQLGPAEPGQREVEQHQVERADGNPEGGHRPRGVLGLGHDDPDARQRHPGEHPDHGFVVHDQDGGAGRERVRGDGRARQRAGCYRRAHGRPPPGRCG